MARGRKEKQRTRAEIDEARAESRAAKGKREVTYVDEADGLLYDDTRSLAHNKFLSDVTPKAGYVFHSDYFKVDTYYATIMSFFHAAGSKDDYGAFWGVNRIPSGLPDGVVTVNLEQVRRMGEKWVQDHQDIAENVANTNSREGTRGGSMQMNARNSRVQEDLKIIAQELTDGASYLSVHNRILVKAPTLSLLDEAVNKIGRFYTDRFGTMHAAPYTGAQREEMSNVFAANKVKRGKPFYYTSTEFAGSYNIVTHGMEDPGGEYVGFMVGDVNMSAIVMDVDAYPHHVVVASNGIDEKRGRVRISDMWASKLSQAAMLNGHRVVHIILNGANLDKLGPKLKKSTWTIDMDSGDLNMFEMFGDSKDELAIFATQLRKLVLMAEQAYETTDHDRSIIRGSLEEVATEFYIDKRMWRENAKERREKLRVVGIPHDQVPKLEEFVSYLNMEYKGLVSAARKDNERLHAMSVLATTFRNLLSNNGDLFNTTTTSAVDGAKSGRRVVYDFGRLMKRGKGIAMAQLVNVIGFAIGNISYGDVVIIHGAELIDPGVRDYMNEQLRFLFDEGGRVVYCYDSVEAMLDDVNFNRFDAADWTCLGVMTERIMTRYQDILGQTIPRDLAKLICWKSNDLCYIRRGFDNVVFKQDLILDPGLKFGKMASKMRSGSKWKNLLGGGGKKRKSAISKHASKTQA